MDSFLDKFSNEQLFWLLVLFIIIASETLKALFRHMFRPLEVWTRAQNRKALRDKFAAHALSALIVHEHSPEQNGKEVISITDLCADAYRYADQMMVQRKEEVQS